MPRHRRESATAGAAESGSRDDLSDYAVGDVDVQLVQPDGTVGAGSYTSPDGTPPSVGDVIPVDEHGGRACVTDVASDEQSLVRAVIE